MKPTTLSTVAAATLLLGACGAKQNATDTNAMETANDNAPAAAAASPAQAFANTAAASDAFEIASSQAASTNASSKDVKAFAARMIDAHTQSTAKLKTAAAGASAPITPDATLSADQQQKLDDLQSKTGTAFDSAYVDDQVAAHEAALDGLRNYSTSGDVAALKDFATQMIPTVTAHLNMAKGLKH